jgi:hypothetical protein
MEMKLLQLKEFRSQHFAEFFIQFSVDRRPSRRRLSRFVKVQIDIENRPVDRYQRGQWRAERMDEGELLTRKEPAAQEGLSGLPALKVRGFADLPANYFVVNKNPLNVVPPWLTPYTYK